MDRYVSQLIEKLAVAEANPTPATNLGNSYEEFEATMLRIEEEANVSAEHLLNVSYQELPPVDRMNHQQIQNLLEAILNALSAKGTDVSIPGNGVPVEVVYSELRKMFQEGFHAMPGWVIDFCGGNCPSCAFADYCESCKEIWTKEELEKEKKLFT